ncbi:MAG: hypothetical protein QNK37_13780 [Acidobacteriota bacterium]|nr:hypothetical protein [Acidobacteriota bacterium]
MTTKIPILVDDQPAEREATLGGDMLSPRGVAGPRAKDVDASVIKASLDRLTGGIAEFLGDVKQVGCFRLKQVTVTVEINAEGKVFLVGKAGAKGGVSLTFEA